jgi:hypothetical protein
VRAFIRNIHAYVGPTEAASINQIGSPKLSALVDLIDQIPNNLITLDTAGHMSLASAKAKIRDVFDTWMANRNAGHSLVLRQFHKSTVLVLDPPFYLQAMKNKPSF